MRILELLQKLALNAKLPVTDAELVKLMANPALAEIDVPDTIATPIQGLMSLDAAMSHSEVKKKFTAEALNGVDSDLKRQMEALGLDAAFIADVMNPSVKTPKRIEQMLAKLTETHAEAVKNAGGAKSDDAKKLLDEINALKAASAEIKKAAETEKTAQESAFENERTAWEIQNLLGAFPRNPTTDVDVYNTSAPAMVSKMLLEKGAKVVRKPGGGLKLVKADDGSDFYIDGTTPANLSDMAKELLVSKGLVAVANPNKPKPGEEIVVEGKPGAPLFSTEYSPNQAILNNLNGYT